MLVSAFCCKVGDESKMSCEILKTEVRVMISVSINVFSRLSTTKGITAMKSWIRPDSTLVRIMYIMLNSINP